MPSPELRISPAQVAGAGLCIGCGGCAAAPGDLEMRMDAFGQYKPRGPGEHRVTTTLAATCPFSPAARNEDEIGSGRFPLATARDARLGRFEAAYVGAASDGGFRNDGSSGGMVSWVAAELLRLGLVDGVAHVVPRSGADGPLFAYQVSRSVDELRLGAKSRYYPVELSGVLREIRATPGRYAVVGIPCFIKAVHLLRASDPVLDQRIAYTLGLFCGHMKSARFAESLAWQLDVPFDRVRRMDFRVKDASRPANWYRARFEFDAETRAEDWWHLADGDWGAGFFQNSACNYCDDVVAETADISFGDAWVEPYSSDGRGTNVVVVRDKALHAMLEQGMAQGRLDLQAVDADFVANTQAAGFRQRREGLAFRLARWRGPLKPKKRVEPRSDGLPLRRRLVYRQREAISRWSHRLFWLAKTLRLPPLYLGWARTSLRWYQALTYSRGRLGQMLDRVLGPQQR